MKYPRRFWALIAIITASIYAATNEPNAQPNPYKTIENWAKLPEGRTWGSAAGVDVDARGHIWVAERCGANSCDGKTDDPILEFDTSGKLLKSFGGGMFVFPHGLYVDKDGNISAEGVAADPKGVIYGAEVGPKGLKKVKK